MWSLVGRRGDEARGRGGKKTEEWGRGGGVVGKKPKKKKYIYIYIYIYVEFLQPFMFFFGDGGEGAGSAFFFFGSHPPAPPRDQI